MMSVDTDSDIVDSLSLTKEHQTVRLVNATGTKVSFSVELDATSTPTNLMINPRRGVIRPGGYTLVRIRNMDYQNRATKSPVLLNLKYKLAKQQILGGVKIRLKDNLEKSIPNLVVRGDLLGVSLRVMRAIILLALIIYNLILIKYHLSHTWVR